MKRTSRTYPEMHGHNVTIYNDPSGVAEASDTYHENIYSLLDHDSIDNPLRCRVENKFSEIKRECSELRGKIPDAPFTTEELLPIIRNLKRRKSHGPNKIVYEHITFGGKIIAQVVVKLLNAIVIQGRIPYSWEKGIIVPIFKGGTNLSLPVTATDQLHYYCVFSKCLRVLLTVALKNM
jgi:hypothetical protein